MGKTMDVEVNDYTMFKDGLMEILADPTSSKADVAAWVKNKIDYSEALLDVLGNVSDDQLEEVIKNNRVSELGDMKYVTDNVVQVGEMIQTVDVLSMAKEVKTSFVKFPSKQDARYLRDMYYQFQARRLALQNQLRALNQGKDKDQPDEKAEMIKEDGVDKKTKKGTENRTFLEFMLYQVSILEKQIAVGLDIFSNGGYLGKWAKEVVGIGPVISTCLMSSLEMRDDNTGNDTWMHAGNWWSYCGLNDNKRPWIGRDAAKQMVKETVEENGGVINDAVVMALSGKSQWPYSYLIASCTDEKGRVHLTVDNLSKAICKVPYNKDLKVLMYKIGESFIRVQNKPNSLYGKIFKQRKNYEIMKNERGDYADQAAKSLKRFGKDTESYKWYKQGKLPPAHIINRAKRYTVKLFISHLFEAMYYNKYGRYCSDPYIISFGAEHGDYIGPEVPYNTIPRDEEFVKIHPTQV